MQRGCHCAIDLKDHVSVLLFGLHRSIKNAWNDAQYSMNIIDWGVYSAHE
jgi:hypothetical protein